MSIHCSASLEYGKQIVKEEKLTEEESARSSTQDKEIREPNDG